MDLVGCGRKLMLELPHYPPPHRLSFLRPPIEKFSSTYPVPYCPTNIIKIVLPLRPVRSVFGRDYKHMDNPLLISYFISDSIDNFQANGPILEVMPLSKIVSMLMMIYPSILSLVRSHHSIPPLPTSS